MVPAVLCPVLNQPNFSEKQMSSWWFWPPPIQVKWDWIPPPQFLYTKKVPQQKFRLNNHPTLELWKKNEQKIWDLPKNLWTLRCGWSPSDPKTSSPKWWWKNGDESMGSQSVTKKHLNTKYWIHQLIPPAHMKGILENGYICWFPKMLGFPQQPWVNSY